MEDTAAMVLIPKGDLRTSMVVKRIFFVLLPDGVPKRGDLLQHFRVDLDHLSEADARVVRQASDLMREAIQLQKHATISYNIRDFEQKQWNITEANVYPEFHTVVSEIFSTGMHWGK